MVVRLDERKVGTFVRVHAGGALAANEKLLEYRIRRGGPRIITDAYHFQEGQAKVFERERKLMFQGSGQDAFRVLWQGGLEFRAAFDNAVRLEFAADGKAVAIYQGGGKADGVRK